MKKEVVYTKNAPQPKSEWSQAVKVGQFIFLSGQTGIDPKTQRVVEGGIEEQTTQAFSNIKAILQAAGATLRDVVSVTLYLRNIDDLEGFNRINRKFFESDFPVRNTIEAARLPLPDILLEVAVIAVLP